MGSTEHEADSGMDDILDSIRKIISEDPLEDGSPVAGAYQTRATEVQQPVYSPEDEVNITQQLASALGSQLAPPPPNPAPSRAAPNAGGAAGPRPPIPEEHVMNLTQPLPNVSNATNPGPANPPQMQSPLPPPSQPGKPGLQGNHRPNGAPQPNPVNGMASRPMAAPEAPQRIMNEPTPAVIRPQVAMPQPPVAERPEYAVPPRPDVPPVVSQSPSAGTPPVTTPIEPKGPPQPRTNGLDALNQALEGVSTAAPKIEAEASSTPESAAIDPIGTLVTPAPPNLSQSEVVDDGDKPQPKTASNYSPTEMAMRDLLRPMIKAWLDDNMPRLAEDVLREEINRIKKSDG